MRSVAHQLSVVIFTAALCAATVRLQADQQKSDIRLIEAVKTGNLTAASELLRKRIDVNASEADGTTALHWAVRQGAVELADKLLRAGANVKAANRYGITAIYLACVDG